MNLIIFRLFPLEEDIYLENLAGDFKKTSKTLQT